MAIANEMHSWNKWHLFLCTGHIVGFYSMLLWCHWRFRMMLLPLKLLTLNLFWVVYIFTIERGIRTNKGGNSLFIFARIIPSFLINIFSEILIFSNITRTIYLQLINSNVTTGDTFKIKSSYSIALTPVCDALVILYHHFLCRFKDVKLF